MPEQEPVLFYATTDPWGELSNWWEAPFELDGHTWPTSEHYFMAQKTKDKRARERIRAASTPRRAKELGREVRLRRGWDGMKFDVMLRANLAKFTQHPHLREVLLSTGDRRIHESCDDPWWGGGPHHPDGKDMLGKVLMRVREQLRAKAAPRPRG